ncbi:hypothetical protein KTH71_01305 [Acinetobacter sp. WU_MDCI_Axc73]|nr:hypothetical protein [Acinetobacter sp. WU_MDCI_Axc73]
MKCTRNKKKSEDDTLVQLIDDYIKNYRPNKLDELNQYARFRDTRNIDGMFNVLAEAKDIYGKMYSHQRRLGFALMKRWVASLTQDKEHINAIKDFAELYQLIVLHLNLNKEKYELLGIGKLCVYDTALRVSAYLGCLPNEIYVQSGSADGVENWGLTIKNGKVNISQLPKTLVDQLQYYEIEDFLCIYKDKLKHLI